MFIELKNGEETVYVNIDRIQTFGTYPYDRAKTKLVLTDKSMLFVDHTVQDIMNLIRAELNALYFRE